MLRDQIQLLIEDAVARLVSEGFLPKEGLPPVEVADPKDPAHGDFACSFALAASKAAGKPPREIAERLAGEVTGRGSQVAGDEGGLIASAEVAGPGFINLRLKPEALAAYVGTILGLGVDGLKSASGPATRDLRDATADLPRLNIEYVSVNPNGPITVGSGRGAAFGSTLANVLEAAGHPVHREYYINDGTNSEQMRLFGLSVRHYVRVFDRYFSAYPFAEVTLACYRIDLTRALMKGEGLTQGYRARRFLSSKPVEWFIQRIDTLVRTFPTSSGLPANWYEVVFGVEELRRTEVAEATAWRRLAEDVKDFALWYNTRNPGHFPKSGYHADYVREVAADILEEYGPGVSANKVGWYQRMAGARMLRRQQSDLTTFSTTFDTWFSEQSLHDSGVVAVCVEELKAKGAADEESYQTQISRKKGEPDEVERVSQEQADLSDVQDEATPDQSEIRNPKSEIGTTLWLRSTKFGDDKDRVLRRKDGRLTYIASDVAYHKDKFNRGSKPDAEGKVQPADKLITILGPDHHGYIGRLTAVVGALLEEVRSPRNLTDRTDRSDLSDLSDNERQLYRSPAERDACLAAVEEAKKKLEVIIFQIVRFVKDGKPAPMRKRDGNIYSLRDLMLEIGRNAAPNADEAEQMRIGKDVARFFYLMRSHDTHMDFDLDLAEKQSDENPVYYVQYAHARICSVIKKAEEAGLQANFVCSVSNVEETGHATHDTRHTTSTLLAHPKELALIKTILDLPHEVRRCAEDYGVHRLTTYAQELAKSYHHFYDACRVIQPENPELSRARLALCHAARIGLRAVFELLGISAPERMDRDETAAAASNA